MGRRVEQGRGMRLDGAERGFIPGIVRQHEREQRAAFGVSDAPHHQSRLLVVMRISSSEPRSATSSARAVASAAVERCVYAPAGRSLVSRTAWATTTPSVLMNATTLGAGRSCPSAVSASISAGLPTSGGMSGPETGGANGPLPTNRGAWVVLGATVAAGPNVLYGAWASTVGDPVRFALAGPAVAERVPVES